jgi:hypothetical protein
MARIWTCTMLFLQCDVNERLRNFDESLEA